MLVVAARFCVSKFGSNIEVFINVAIVPLLVVSVVKYSILFKLLMAARYCARLIP